MCVVEQASLRNTGIFKPNPYVELSVDNRSTRKTEFVKHTYLPKWNEDFTVLVTPQSEIVFKVLDHSSFLKDGYLGERSLNLNWVLQQYNGRCENLELNMDLHCKTDIRSGELVAVLNGLKIDMADLQSANGGSVGAGAATSQSGESGYADGSTNNAGRSTILVGGIRSRMRLRGTSTGDSTTSANSSIVSTTGIQTLGDLRQLRMGAPNQRMLTVNFFF